jgi:predicted RecA/RadA family phage recombinase
MAYDRLCILSDETRQFTAKAAGVVSGGFLVKWNSGTDVVGSDTSTYAYDDVAISACDSADNVLGLALQTATSGTDVTIIHEGIVILPAGSSAISGGEPVISCGYGNMVQYTPMNRAVGSGLQYVPIGRALSTATALTGFAVVRLNV